MVYYGGGIIFFAHAQSKFLPKYLRTGNQPLQKFTRYTSDNGWIIFRQDTIGIKPDTFFEQFSSSLGLDNDYQFRVLKDETDEKQFRHRRYQLFFKNIRVEGAEYMLHDRNNRLESANGRIVEDLAIDVANPVEERLALLMALADQKLSLASFKDLSQLPKGELVIASVNQTFVKENFILCYAFNVALPGLTENYRVFVDARSRAIIRRLPLFTNCLHEKPVLDGLTPARAVEKPVSGKLSIFDPPVIANFIPNYPRYLDGQATLNFETHQFGSSNVLYILNTQLNTRIDVQSTGKWADNPDVQSPSLAWGNNASNATTAHWLTEQMYQYYQAKHGRNGYDGNGTYPRVLINVPVNNFAQWDQTQNTIRVGFLNGRSLVTADVIGHEYAHAVTQYGANLIYEAEPGAINESISDIFGTALERQLLPNANANQWDWTIGEDAFSLRSMSNPSAFGHPANFANLLPISPPCNTDNDFCKVHSNSGIMNKWFFNLASGGVMSIPFDNATNIIYTAQRYYMNSNSNYNDVRDATWFVAQAFYGSCSDAQKKVAASWRAVGLYVEDCPPGCDYQLGSIVATNTGCNQPLALSVNCAGDNVACNSDIIYLWDGPTQFNSNTGANTTTTAPATAGNYTYSVTGSKGGCTSRTSTITVNISCSGSTNGCSQQAISVVSHSPNQTLTANSFPFYFDIRTQVCDPQGVNQVQYIINGNWAGYVDSPDNNSSQPYTLTAGRWAALAGSNNAFTINQPGTYTIQPRLFSNAGGYLDAAPVQITVVQGGGGNPPNPGGGLTFGTPTFDCSSGQLVLSTTGGNGTPVEFRAPGLQDWSTNNVLYVDPIFRSGTTFTIQARQSGTEITPINYTVSCAGYRLSAAGDTPAPTLIILPNPTTGRVTVRFLLAAGQRAVLHTVSSRGVAVQHRPVTGTGNPQDEVLHLEGEPAGVYLLNLEWGSGRMTGKVLLQR